MSAEQDSTLFQAEQAVLSAMLDDKVAITRAKNILAPASFSSAAHRAFATAIYELHAEGIEVDPLTLSARMEKLGTLQPAGGKDYIGYLIDATPTSANVEYHAKIVKAEHDRKRTISYLETALTALKNGEANARQVAADAQAVLLPLAIESDEKGFRELTVDHIQQAIAEMHRRGEQTKLGNIPGFATGYASIDRETQGFRPGEFIVIGGVPKSLKALPINTPVRTTDGWKPIGQMSIGDQLVSIDGAPSRVTGVYPQGSLPVYRVNFSDGATVECCGEHLWEVQHRRWLARRVVTTLEIERMIKLSKYKKRLSIPLVAGVMGDGRALPIHPYLLGALIGDGGLTDDSTPRFTAFDSEVVEKVRLTLPPGHALRMEKDRKGHFRIVAASKKWAAVTLIEDLRRMGLMVGSAEKFIPPDYLLSSQAQRLQLLQGLLDTDGQTTPGTGVVYVTTSDRLARDIRSLVLSLGGLVNIVKFQPFCLKPDGVRTPGHPANRITIKGGAWLLSHLTLTRHKKHLIRTTRREPRRVILSVERLAFSTPMVCIAVDHPSKLYVIKDYVVTHNTAFVFNVIINAACRREFGGVVSAEMTFAALLERSLAAAALVPISSMSRGSITDMEEARIKREGARLAGHLAIDDQSLPELSDVIARATDLKARHPRMKYLAVDYIQLVQHRMGGRRGDEEINGITRALKGLAKRLEVVVIAPAQANYKELEQRNEKRPELRDFQGASGMAQDADFAALIYNPRLYNTTAEPILELAFKACRRTSQFTAYLPYQPDTLAIIEPQRKGAAA